MSNCKWGGLCDGAQKAATGVVGFNPVSIVGGLTTAAALDNGSKSYKIPTAPSSGFGRE